MFHDDLLLVTSLLRPLATLQLPRTDLSVYSHKLSTKLTLVDVTRSYKLITERRVKACQFSLTSAPSLQFLFISAQSSSEFGILFLLLLESSLPLFSREFLIDYHNILDSFRPKVFKLQSIGTVQHRTWKISQLLVMHLAWKFSILCKGP